MMKNFKDYSGFTLIELITAIVLLTLVLLPALGAFNRSFQRSDQHIEQVLEAQLLLRAAITNPVTAIVDTLIVTTSPSGHRFRLINRLVYSGTDTNRQLVVMSQRGAIWDTLLNIIIPCTGETVTLLR